MRHSTTINLIGLKYIFFPTGDITPCTILMSWQNLNKVLSLTTNETLKKGICDSDDVDPGEKDKGKIVMTKKIKHYIK